jgi:hypothetical protein
MKKAHDIVGFYNMEAERINLLAHRLPLCSLDLLLR